MEYINVGDIVNNTYILCELINKSRFSKVFYCYKILNSNKLNYHISYDYDKKTKYIIKITTRKMESIFYMLKLDIDGIINPYDIFIKNDLVYIIFPYISDCIDLVDYQIYCMDNMKSKTEYYKQILFVLYKISCIFKNLHNNNIIHTDIKPDNVLIHKSTGKIYIIDFGDSCVYDTNYDNEFNYRNSQCFGSLEYLPPEMLVKCDKYDDTCKKNNIKPLNIPSTELVSYKMDVYSFGMMIIAILFTNSFTTFPLEFKNILKHFTRNISDDNKINIGKKIINNNISLKLNELINNCMYRIPDKRCDMEYINNTLNDIVNEYIIVSEI